MNNWLGFGLVIIGLQVFYEQWGMVHQTRAWLKTVSVKIGRNLNCGLVDHHWFLPQIHRLDAVSDH